MGGGEGGDENVFVTFRIDEGLLVFPLTYVDVFVLLSQLCDVTRGVGTTAKERISWFQAWTIRNRVHVIGHGPVFFSGLVEFELPHLSMVPSQSDDFLACTYICVFHRQGSTYDFRISVRVTVGATVPHAAIKLVDGIVILAVAVDFVSAETLIATVSGMRYRDAGRVLHPCQPL